ncbi:MAG TPA: HAD hydrolase family protein, partial [Gaiellaceae bacterium]|nr:HAD hydrolase family protein [Gaiellaceae bacterium]
LEAELEPRFAGRLFISKSLPFFLEFAHPDVSKGSGLAFVADRLGFGQAETVACGDGENDRELLDWAGFGVAVANAHEDVLARADLVVPSVEEEGVAVLLEAYLDSVA